MVEDKTVTGTFTNDTTGVIKEVTIPAGECWYIDKIQIIVLSGNDIVGLSVGIYDASNRITNSYGRTAPFFGNDSVTIDSPGYGQTKEINIDKHVGSPMTAYIRSTYSASNPTTCRYFIKARRVI
jgi:hypothetical protein